MIMRALVASFAIAMSLSGGGHAQAREVVAPKAAASPTAKVKGAPRVLPANAMLPSKPAAEERAYSDLIDHVSKTMDHAIRLAC